MSNKESKNFTKECIYEALWELLKTKPFAEITITQIAEKAGVSRNAIYRKFSSKEMIIKSRLYEKSKEFVELFNNLNISDHREYIRIVFEFLCNQKHITKILIDSGLSLFLLEAFTHAKRFYTTETRNDYYEYYRIGGTYFVYITWLMNGCVETPEELTDIVCYICNNNPITPDITINT